MEQRRSGRRPSWVELEARAQGRKFLAQFYDLSAEGCRFDCSGSHLCTGDRIVFNFAEHTKVQGKLAWRDGPMAGVRFASPWPAAIVTPCPDHPVDDTEE